MEASALSLVTNMVSEESMSLRQVCERWIYTGRRKKDMEGQV